ncbi:MAG: Nif3-like dinuclear metal center hexameric protein [Anaerolineae bacterium]
MERHQLTQYLDTYLRIAEISDYGPQGLQVETENEQVQRVALAVDTAPPVIEAAAAWGADMLLVHHGILWRSVERIAGPLGVRVRRLLAHGVNLYAAHLPLDAHPEVGNNAVLAQMFGVRVTRWWHEERGAALAALGQLDEPRPVTDLATEVEEKLHGRTRLLPHGPENAHTIAILSGFGADFIGEAKALGADTFITGETSHANYWAAADYGLNLIYAGHYATETVGVQALGRHLAQKFGLDVKFFDFPTEM